MADQSVTPAANASAAATAQAKTEVNAAAAPAVADSAAAKIAADNVAKAAATAGQNDADASEAKPGDNASAAAVTDQNKSNPPPPDPKAQQEKVVPDKYELKLPDGSPLDPARVQAVSEFAKQNKLSNDEAQAVLTKENDVATHVVQRQKVQLKTLSDGWTAASKADPEIAGADGKQFDKNVQYARTAMEALFPGAEIKKWMDDTGMGNNPQVLKGFARIGRLMESDKAVIPNGQPAAQRKGSMESRLYDNPTSQQTKQT